MDVMLLIEVGSVVSQSLVEDGLLLGLYYSPSLEKEFIIEFTFFGHLDLSDVA